MRTIRSEQIIGELAAEYPAAARVLEKLGIDYCCAGSRTLEQASRAAGLLPDQVRVSLEAALDTKPATAQATDWNAELLADLITHIQATHHQFRHDRKLPACCRSWIRSAPFTGRTIPNWHGSAPPSAALRRNYLRTS